MPMTAMKPRVTSFAPQFLVDDLEHSIAYQKLGFTFGEPWDGFYAIGYLDGLELHLKEAPKDETERRYRRDNEHLDASTASTRSTSSASLTEQRSSGRSRPPRGARRTSMLRTPMATSSPSAGAR